MDIKICGLFLVLFAFYNCGFARRCYFYVDEKPFNENTTSMECNPFVTQAGLNGYSAFYNFPKKNLTSIGYDCFVIQNTTYNWAFGGCIYSGEQYCNFPLRNNSMELTCKQCVKDDCNGGAFGIAPSYFILILAGATATVLSSRLF